MEVTIGTKKRTIADVSTSSIENDLPEPGSSQATGDTTQSAQESQEDASTPPKRLKLTASNGYEVLLRSMGSTRRRAPKRTQSRTVEEPPELVMDEVQVKPKKPKKKGKLSFLPSLPLDILYEIFKLLLPTDLLFLSRTTKALRAVLLNRSATTVWMASTAHLPDFPPTPDDMSLPAWTSLLLDTFCQNCFQEHAYADFILRVRCCSHCASSLLVPLSKYPKMTSVLTKAVPSSRWNGEKHIRATKKELDAFLASWKKRTTLGDPLTEERALVAKRNESGKNAKKWFDDRTTEGAEERLELKLQRSSDIQAKLTQLGYADELSFLLRFKTVCVIDPLPYAVPEFDRLPQVNQPTKLTNRAWKTIEQDMVDLMLRMKDLIKDNNRAIVMRERREVMQRLYLAWRNQKDTLEQYPAHYFMPGPMDVIRHYRFADTLDLSSDIKLDAWTKRIQAKFDKILPDFVRTWREDCTNWFLEEVEDAPAVENTLRWHLSGNYEGSPMKRKHEQLQLATVVFRCTDYLTHSIVDAARVRDEGVGYTASHELCKWKRTPPVEPLLWYPAFLTHPCTSIKLYEPDEGRHPTPEASLCLNSTYGFTDRIYDTGLYQRSWTCDHLEFDEVASRTVWDILEACGLRSATTVAELDDICPRLVCLKCSFGAKPDGERPMRVFGWREAVNHAVKTHFGNSLVKWERLSPEDTEKVFFLEATQAIYHDYPKPSDQRVWRCTACLNTTDDSGRMNKARLERHFERNPTHGAPEKLFSRENMTYFRDPEMAYKAVPRITMIPGKAASTSAAVAPEP